MIIPGNLPALIVCESFTCGLPGRFPFHCLCFLAHGWDSIPVAPNASGIAGQPSRGESLESRGNRALPRAKQTARQPRRAAVPVAIPMNGPPDIRIGVCCRCNKPGNRGNTRSCPATLLGSPRTLVGAVHTLSAEAVCPRGRHIPSVFLRAQCIIQIRFCRSPSVWYCS
jgi:hypothetical protein